jgi:hypothetical protein
MLSKLEIAALLIPAKTMSGLLTLSFAFGKSADSRGAVAMAVPLLAGDPREPILPSAERERSAGGLSLWRSGEEIAGSIRTAPGSDIEGATADLYSRVFGALGGRRLYRMWNLVPRINAGGPGGLENYRSFCRGRSLAFEAAYGAGFARSLPASTAVGTAADQLAVVFLAGARPPRHYENPAQIPAYEYPPEHGPRPPSFARATVVERPGRTDAFISGTSAVVGHATVAPNDTAAQLDCTIENLRGISRACGLGEGPGAAGKRHFKVYLRKASDLPGVARELERRMLAEGDRVSYLEADICRAELNVEIELAVRGAESS